MNLIKLFQLTICALFLFESIVGQSRRDEIYALKDEYARLVREKRFDEAKAVQNRLREKTRSGIHDLDHDHLHPHDLDIHSHMDAIHSSRRGGVHGMHDFAHHATKRRSGGHYHIDKTKDKSMIIINKMERFRDKFTENEVLYVQSEVDEYLDLEKKVADIFFEMDNDYEGLRSINSKDKRMNHLDKIKSKHVGLKSKLQDAREAARLKFLEIKGFVDRKVNPNDEL